MMRYTYGVSALGIAALVALTGCAGASGTGAGGSADSASAATAATSVDRWGVPGSKGKTGTLEKKTPTPVSGISGKVVQISTTNSDGYALTSDGAVWAWGYNDHGQLGDGSTGSPVTRAVRVSFPAGVTITKLPDPMPFDAALAIDSHGRAWGWGLDRDGDLCQPGGNETRPRQLPPQLSDVTLATGAKTHSLFDSHGTVYACGSGDGGALGDGSTTGSTKPVAVTGLPRGAHVTALTSSWEDSGALLSDGTFYAWGYNPVGQLGDGSTANSDVPVRVQLPAPVRQVSQGGSIASNGQTVAILADGSTWSWGTGTDGQLGNGSTANSDVPVRVHVPDGVRFTAVNSGGFSSYGIDQSGRLWAWGGNQNGQLGTGSSARGESSPVHVAIRLTQVSSTASDVAGF